jgi:hypothetical protein
MGRVAWGAAIALLAIAMVSGTAAASGPQYLDPQVFAATPDGRSALLGTVEPLTADDTDTSWDLFLWKDGETRLVTTGPTRVADRGYGSYGYGLSGDGKRAVFTTWNTLTADDTDGAGDVYERYKDRTTLLSTGPTDPSATSRYEESSFAGQAANGAVVFFITKARMVTADDDTAQDVYRRENGVTTLVATDAAGRNTPGKVDFAAVSPNGGRVLVSTTDALLPEDRDDGKLDTYAFVNGAAELLTKGDAKGTAADTTVESVTPDATSVVFKTTDRLVFGDLDDLPDYYQRRAGVTRLVSADPHGRSLPCTTVDPGYPGSPYLCEPYTPSQSPSGAHVTFNTGETLTSDDQNANVDLYDRHDGTTERITRSGPTTFGMSGFWGPITDDGSRVIFNTSQPLDPRDTDTCYDAYERVDGVTRLLSTGPTDSGCEDVRMRGNSTDLRHVFFQTVAALVPEDRDQSLDGYEAFGGTTRLVSTGPTDGNGANIARLWQGVVTPDGLHVYFVTNEHLMADDTDDQPDAYMRAGGQTTLLTPG